MDEQHASRWSAIAGAYRFVRRRAGDLSLLERLLIMEGALFLLSLSTLVILVRWYSDSMTRRIDAEHFQFAQAFAEHLEDGLVHHFAELDATGAQLLASASERPLVDRSEVDSAFPAGILAVRNGRVFDATPPARSLIGQSLWRLTEPTSFHPPGATIVGVRLPDGAPGLALALPVRRDTVPMEIIGLLPLTEGSMPSIIGRAVDLARTGHGEVVDRQGLAIFSTEPGHLLQASDHPDFFRLFVDHALPSGTYAVRHGDGDSDEWHSMTFVRFRELPWILALGGTSEEIYAPVSTLWRTFYLAATTAGLMGGLITFVGARSLTRPVQRLSDSAREVASGQLATRLHLETGGEIGELARSVERMRSALYDWGVTLDRRVAERTHELELRNVELAVSAAISRLAGATLDLEEMLRGVTDHLERTFDAAAVVVTLPARGQRGALHVSSARLRSRAAVAPGGCGACIADADEGTATFEPGDPRLPACLRQATAAATGEAGYSLVAVQARINSGGRVGGTLCLLFSQRSEREIPSIETLRLLASTLSFGIRNADLYADLVMREGQARSLVGKVLTAQEEERRRLARELHDDTGQVLASVMLGVESIERMPTEDPALRSRQIAVLREILRDAIASLRATIAALRPPALDELGLRVAIQRYADTHAAPLGIRVSVSGDVDSRRLGPDGEMALFRVVQEALNNVVRHSGASQATVLLAPEDDGSIRLEVRDNGHGFDVDAVRRGDAMGIFGMTERAEMLGGALRVQSAPGEGTVVMGVFPPSPGSYVRPEE